MFRQGEALSYLNEIAALDELKYELDIKTLYQLASNTYESPGAIKKFAFPLESYAYPRMIEALSIYIAQQSTEQLGFWEAMPNEDFIKDLERIFQIKFDEKEMDSDWEDDKTNLQKLIHMQLSLKDIDRRNIPIPFIPAGPLSKNSATSTLETIFQNRDKWQFSLNKRNELVANGPDGFLNISYLMLAADFTQLKLEDKSLNAEKEEKAALLDYTDENSTHNYKVINGLLRSGIVSTNNPNPQTLKDLFSAVCRVSSFLNKVNNDSQVELNHLYQEVKQKYLASHHNDEKRQNNVALRDQDVEIIKYAVQSKLMTQAQVNQWIEHFYLGNYRDADISPQGLFYNEGYISTSQGKLLSIATSDRKLKVLSLGGANVRHYSIYEYEAERLQQAHKQNFYIHNDNLVIAHDVNTPLLENIYDIKALEDTSYVYDNFLEKPFKEAKLCADDLEYENVQRPNHGLPHTFRTIMYVDGIIDYLKAHFNDPDLKKYFKKINSDTIEKIKTASAFAVTGRESEVNWKDDLEAVKRYKAQAKVNFTNYVSGRKDWSKEDIERYGKLIQYMGIPDFLTDKNLCKDEEDEAAFYVMTLAHNLDLLRCYDDEDYLRSVETFIPGKNILIENTAAANKDWERLQTWALQMLIVTGDRIQSTNNLMPLKKSYQGYDKTVFCELATNPLAFYKVVSQLPYPFFNNMDSLKQTITRYIKTILYKANSDKENANYYWYLTEQSTRLSTLEFEKLLNKALPNLNIPNNVVVALLMINDVCNGNTFFINFYNQHSLQPELQMDVLNELKTFTSKVVSERLPSSSPEGYTQVHHQINSHKEETNWLKKHFSFYKTKNLVINPKTDRSLVFINSLNTIDEWAELVKSVGLANITPYYKSYEETLIELVKKANCSYDFIKKNTPKEYHGKFIENIVNPDIKSRKKFADYYIKETDLNVSLNYQRAHAWLTNYYNYIIANFPDISLVPPLDNLTSLVRSANSQEQRLGQQVLAEIAPNLTNILVIHLFEKWNTQASLATNKINLSLYTIIANSAVKDYIISQVKTLESKTTEKLPNKIILLYALIVEPKNWSKHFVSLLKNAIPLISKEKFGNPKLLTHELEILLSKAESEEKLNSSANPNVELTYLVTPNKIETNAQWLKIAAAFKENPSLLAEYYANNDKILNQIFLSTIGEGKPAYEDKLFDTFPHNAYFPLLEYLSNQTPTFANITKLKKIIYDLFQNDSETLDYEMVYSIFSNDKIKLFVTSKIDDLKQYLSIELLNYAKVSKDMRFAALSQEYQKNIENHHFITMKLLQSAASAGSIYNEDVIAAVKQYYDLIIEENAISQDRFFEFFDLINQLYSKDAVNPFQKQALEMVAESYCQRTLVSSQSLSQAITLFGKLSQSGNSGISPTIIEALRNKISAAITEQYVRLQGWMKGLVDQRAFQVNGEQLIKELSALSNLLLQDNNIKFIKNSEAFQDAISEFASLIVLKDYKELRLANLKIALHVCPNNEFMLGYLKEWNQSEKNPLLFLKCYQYVGTGFYLSKVMLDQLAYLKEHCESKFKNIFDALYQLHQHTFNKELVPDKLYKYIADTFKYHNDFKAKLTKAFPRSFDESMARHWMDIKRNATSSIEEQKTYLLSNGESAFDHLLFNVSDLNDLIKLFANEVIELLITSVITTNKLVSFIKTQKDFETLLINLPPDKIASVLSAIGPQQFSFILQKIQNPYEHVFNIFHKIFSVINELPAEPKQALQTFLQNSISGKLDQLVFKNMSNGKIEDFVFSLNRNDLKMLVTKPADFWSVFCNISKDKEYKFLELIGFDHAYSLTRTSNSPVINEWSPEIKAQYQRALSSGKTNMLQQQSQRFFQQGTQINYNNNDSNINFNPPKAK